LIPYVQNGHAYAATAHHKSYSCGHNEHVVGARGMDGYVSDSQAAVDKYDVNLSNES